MLKNFGGEELLPSEIDQSWLALMIGNSRLHWAWFVGKTLRSVWDLPHLPPDWVECLVQHQLDFSQCLSWIKKSAVVGASEPPPNWPQVPAQLPLYIASVIPAQTQLWQAYTRSQVLGLEQIPLQNLYPTLGIDRALALWGSAIYYGLPSLVIDAGTALTFTGAGMDAQFVGGAILPGLQLQLRSLAEHTAALPHLSSSEVLLPSRWTTNTAEAIWSGVLHTLLAGIKDFIRAWRREISGGTIILTGGDAALFFGMLKQQDPDLAAQIKVDPQLIFRGMQAVAANL